MSQSWVDSWISSFELGAARAAVDAAQSAVLSLLSSLGSSTEPDLAGILPAYDRMTAIALLLVAAFAALALIERQLGGNHGAGPEVIARTLVACFTALTGLTLLQYLESNAALLASAWTPSFLGQNSQLSQTVTRLYSEDTLSAPALGSVAGLCLTALLTLLLALFVYIELILRAALIAVTATFIPLVAAMWIWPRLSSAAVHMGQFLVGLLLSKFVIATAVYVGYSFVVAGLAGAPGAQGNGLVVGLATLSVAALAPFVLLQGLHFGRQATAPVARSWSVSAAQLATSAGRSLRGPASRLLATGRQRLGIGSAQDPAIAAGNREAQDA